MGTAFTRLALGALLLALVSLTASAQLRSSATIRNGEGGLGNVLGNEDSFGSGVASLGDLDGDGISELAVGVPYDNDGAFDAGAVYILFMNRDGRARSVRKISATQGGVPFELSSQGHFGRSVAALGDIDGDRVPDMIVGVPEGRGLEIRTGAAFVIRLNSDGTIKGVEKIALPNTAPQGFSTGFGYSVAGIGDIDGDGVRDAAVSAPYRGEIHILFLTATGSLREKHTIDSNNAVLAGKMLLHERLGDAVAGIGDFDRDGIPDIATGIGENAIGGRVLLLMLGRDGAPRGMKEISTITSPILSGVVRTGDYFGFAIADPGDLDGDGTRDLAVGAWGDDIDPIRNNGAIYILYMTPAATVRSFTKINASDPLLAGRVGTEDRLGMAVTSLGDLDRDGALDLATGVDWDDPTPNGFGEGAVLVLFGSEPMTSAVPSDRAAASFALSNPTPNPFMGSATVMLTLDRPQHVDATLVDPLGRTVATIADRWMEAGTHQLDIDAPAAGAGIYLLRVQSGKVLRTRTMTLVR